MTRARRPRRSRLLGVALLLVLLEGALQVASLIVAWNAASPIPPSSADADLTVLCVGDSNTYGLGMPHWSYPSQLRPRLLERYAGDVQVVNLGTPGFNTSEIAKSLERAAPELEPDLVFLLGGINDAWNSNEMPGSPWYTHVKLVELALNIAAGDTNAGDHRPRYETDDKGEVLVVQGGERHAVNPGSGDLLRSGDALAATTRAGLSRALAACRAADARPVLMTYAEDRGNFAVVNAATRALAAETGVLLVDHAAVFERAFAEGRYASLMRSDQHPNIAGYALMTDTIMAALDAAGWLPAPGAGAGTSGRPAPGAPTLEFDGDATLSLGGPDDWAWQLLVSGPPEAGAPNLASGAVTLPLAEGPALDFSRDQPAFAGRFDAEGRASLRLPAALFATQPGPLIAVLVLLRDPGEPEALKAPLAAHSDPVELRGP